MKFVFLVGVLGIVLPAFVYGNKDSSTMEQRQKLRNELLHTYDKYNYPDNLTLALGLSLISFDVDEASNSIKLYAWLKQSWTDSRLSWDAEETPGWLRMPSHELWRPDITLYNSVDLRETTPCGETNMVVYPSGKIISVPPCTYTAYCEDLTQKNAPTLNAEHECELKFGSWTLDGITMDLQSYGNETKVDIAELREGSNWRVLSSEIIRNEKYYPCCKEPYLTISFKIKFQKKTG